VLDKNTLQTPLWPQTKTNVGKINLVAKQQHPSPKNSTSALPFSKLLYMDKDLKNKTLDELAGIVTDLGGEKYLANYIFTFIHSKNTSDISHISPLSKAFRNKLSQQGYYISQLITVRTFTASDGTIKYLFELTDGNRIESVLLFDNKRKTLCVSTQAGCPMNCAFCATAKLKFRRNLTAAEIVDQVITVHKDRHEITNVVYMGMGEPLKNYDAVLKSLRILNHPMGKNFGLRHLTISTCGIVPAIEKLAVEDIHPRLAISLNAPTDSIRTKLMRINTQYPLTKLFKAVKLYQHKTGLRVTFEYVLIKNLNDTVLHARMLTRQLRYLKCNVNLIEYNPHLPCQFLPAGKEAIDRFANILNQAGIKTTIRLKMGQEINAGCGQLGADWLNNKLL